MISTHFPNMRGNRNSQVISSNARFNKKCIVLCLENLILIAFMDNTGFWYNFVFAVLIILFTYFYTAITINPTQMSDDLKRNNGFIPGVKPGKNTKDYLDTIMDRITLPGAFFLALVAIMPAFARIAGVSMEFSQFFGGTSLLILVGVVLDTLQQVESHLLMRHYDGLLKSGQATMVFSAPGEQKMDFRVHNTTWEPVDLDGIKLMRRPLPSARASKMSENGERNEP